MKTVLIIDDAAFMRVTIKNMLSKNGYEVVGEAENGQVGLTEYQELKPDIVTLDITMPVMDGLTALKKIMEVDPKANIVMLSAMGQQDMVKEAIISGAKGFIVKPFKEDVVLKALENLF